MVSTYSALVPQGFRLDVCCLLPFVLVCVVCVCGGGVLGVLRH